MENYPVTAWCHQVIAPHIAPGSFCIDATMGKGNDTAFLSRLAGPSGRVLAFDIQKEALECTRQRLQTEALPENYTLILDSHAHMDQYADVGSVDAVLFNFGYLPGGDHRISTQPDTSLRALNLSLELLKKGGFICLTIYSGGDTGYAERDALLSFLKELDSRRYLVIRTDYYNRPGNPPILALVIRLR